MRTGVVVFALMGAMTAAATAQTPIDVQPVKELKPTGSLGTCGYKPVDQEAPSR